MDKQEMYVAASRSRGETLLYPTAEIQAERDKFAPRSPHLREGLPHIAEAAERDRAQLAAHDEALRVELRRLPTQEIVARRAELHDEVRREGRVRTDHIEQAPHIRIAEGQYRVATERREAVEDRGWRQRRRELPDALEREAVCREALERTRARTDRNGPLTEVTTREDAIAGRILAERRELAIIAARIEPPPISARSWGRGPAIQRSGRPGRQASRPSRVTARSTASGTRTTPLVATATEVPNAPVNKPNGRLQQVQRELGSIREAARVRDMGRSMGIGR
jgi:hypothetical protein